MIKTVILLKFLIRYSGRDMIASGWILIMAFIVFLAFTLSTFLLFIHYPKSRSVRLLALFTFFLLLGLVLTSLRNKIPIFLSLEVGVMALAIAYLFLYLGLKNMLISESKWYNYYYIPLFFLFVGLYLFTHLYYDLHMRIVLFSLYLSPYIFATAILFYDASRKFYKRVHQFIALLYLLFSLVFILRAINSISFGYNLEFLLPSEFILYSPYILLIVMTLILIVMSNIYIRKDKRL